MFTFANCLILIFLFGETSSNSQQQNPSNFWHDLMKENGIWDEQMVVEMDKSDSFIEKLSKEENYKKLPSPNELQHSGKQSLFSKLFKLDNFYELVNGQKEIAKLVQDLAKTFINIKSSPIKNGQIEISQIKITKILDQTEKAMNFLAKQKGIVHGKAEQLELPKIVKIMATIWSEMSRINNGENANEIVQKIVNLWQSVKQNDEFNEYFGNKREGKNRRGKRRTHTRTIYIAGQPMSMTEFITILTGIFFILFLCCLFLSWSRRSRS